MHNLLPKILIFLSFSLLVACAEQPPPPAEVYGPGPARTYGSPSPGFTPVPGSRWCREHRCTVRKKVHYNKYENKKVVITHICWTRFKSGGREERVCKNIRRVYVR